MKLGRGRVTIRILAGVSLALALFWGHMRFYAGKAKQRIVSLDGKFIAQVREFQTGSAVDSDYIAVQIQTRWNPLRHDVYGGLDYGIGIKIYWADSSNLVVTCTNCEKLGEGLKENKRHDVAIRYVGQ
jgi:hypothetical protein